MNGENMIAFMIYVFMILKISFQPAVLKLNLV